MAGFAPPQPQMPQMAPQGQPPRPEPPTPPIDPMYAPVSGTTYEIDPLVLERPVRIKIQTADQMVRRENMRQALPMIAQLLLNPVFIKEIGQIGYKPDYVTIMRLFQETTGLGRAYPLLAALTPEEKQAHNTPPPEVQARMQQSQMDAQVRREAMQVKAQTETMIAQLEAATKAGIVDEQNRLKLLELMLREQEMSQNQPDPRMQMLEFQAKQREKELEYHSKVALTRLDMQNQQMKNEAANQQAIQQMKLDAIKGQMQFAQTARMGALQQRLRPPQSTEDSNRRPDSKPTVIM